MNASEAQRQKQLGQYFTGVPVARLLAALAGAETAGSIVDPMVGSGDMLRACLELGARPSHVMGVEIDGLTLEKAAEAIAGYVIPEVSMVERDSFAATFPTSQFDLVITNPPYIRYQKADVQAISIAVPTASEVRRNLIRAIEQRNELSLDARNIFLEAARKYSGTSDIAVPAWILAASLVADDGTLAVVVPQAWLSRDYAEPVRRMLDRAFRVEYLVEDGDASWFADAQVRTHLIVARRRPIDGASTGRDDVVHARATRRFVRDGKLVGDLRSEGAVADALAATTSTSNNPVTDGLSARREKRVVKLQKGPAIPNSIGQLLSNQVRCAFDSMAGLGWEVGQGMRTGANDFFYLDREDRRIVPAKRWGDLDLPIPEECLVPAIRRQRDLPHDVRVNLNDTTTELLVLDGWITVQDRQRAMDTGVSSSWLSSRYRTLDESVGDWIEVVGETALLEAKGTRLFRDLTAVATNARTGKDGEPLSFWYQLPDLKRRHRPEMFMPRVCGGKPFVKVNDGSDCVVDANFATAWRRSRNALEADAMLALLSSTWAWANLESHCNVLGGGALKIEATDLRRLALPVLDNLAIDTLTGFGKRLASLDDTDVLEEIDRVIAVAIVGRERADLLVAQLTDIASNKMRERSSQED